MLRSSDILRFYLPLVLTSQMMTLSGPIINVGIGRSADPTIEFAGYWLGFAVLLFLESPCLSVQQISATLIGNTPSIPRLIRVALSFGVLSTLLILTVALIDPVSAWIFRTVVPTTPRVAEVARTVLLLQSPIPLLLCLRGLANGFAIRQKRTDLVARATVVRLVTLSLGVGLFVAGASGSGAIAGAVALVTGIALETATVLWSVSRKARTAWHQTTVGSPAPYRFILRVALPLVVAGTTWTALRPIINAALGTLPDPERAQAGFGVVLPFVLATCSPLWIMHNVTLVLPRSVRDLRIVARFAAGTSLFFALLVLLVTWTGLRHWLLRDVFGLNDALAADVTPAIRIVAVEPFLLAGRGFAQGIL
ncbi:MAG: hypothetical protein KC729_17515, partial [Candidatus Eisenbacteria bacterium]|nr:hypothetical protein [Candidatus Eisenbacteria bacterium]